MSSNENLIRKKYSDGAKEDERATRSRSEGLEFHYTKKIMDDYIGKDSRVLEIGCATGYYAMYYADKCKEYVGIDIVPDHIEIFNLKIKKNNLKNVSAMVGDATNLKNIPDGSFDVVCCFGPMYHLPPEERALVFAECRRVCKGGGIAAFAYINKIGVYFGACMHEKYRDRYPNAITSKYVFELGTDDEKPGIFFFTMPEEMEEMSNQYGFLKLRNAGTDFFITMDVIDQMDDEKFSLYMELADKIIEYESCTGMSNHALLVCRKEK